MLVLVILGSTFPPEVNEFMTKMEIRLERLHPFAHFRRNKKEKSLSVGLNGVHLPPRLARVLKQRAFRGLDVLPELQTERL